MSGGVTICPSCGKQSGDAAFCAHCGGLLPGAGASSQAPTPEAGAVLPSESRAADLSEPDSVVPTDSAPGLAVEPPAATERPPVPSRAMLPSDAELPIVQPVTTAVAAAQAGSPRTVVEPVTFRDPDFGDIGLYVARRLMALLVDLVGVTVLCAVAIEFLFVRRGQDPRSFETFFGTVVYTLFVLIVYLIVTEAYLGTTLGKALFNLRVRAAGGGPVGIWRALLRNIFLPFDLALIGFILAAVTPRRRRLGDYIGNTEVVNGHFSFAVPIVALVILGGWGYAEYAYADGSAMAETLSESAQVYGPSLVSGQPPPPPPPAPLPARTPVPTEQPITVPTLAPTPTSSPVPSGGPSTTPSTTTPAPTLVPSSAEPVAT